MSSGGSRFKVVPVETRDPYFSPNGKHAIAKPTAAIKKEEIVNRSSRSLSDIHPSSSPSVVQPTSGIPVQQRPASHLIAPNPKPVYTVPKVAPTAQVKASTIIQPTVNGQVKVSSETQISTGVMVAEANQSRRTKRAPLVRAKTVMSEIAEVVPKIIEAIFSSVQEPFKTFNITIKPLENSRSFWSECYQILVTPNSEAHADKVVSPIFVKIPRISAINAACDPDNADENMEILRTLTAQEVTFYSDFSGIQFSGFPIPRSYYGENLGNEKMAGLACEDYSGKVYSIDFVPGFDESQVLQLLEALAHFHAKIIEISDEIPWKNYENVLYDAAYIRMLHNDTLDFEKLCPAELSGRIQEVKHAFDEDGVRNSEKKNEKLGMPLVICHNDLNASNVLWNNETGKIQAFIDFQHVSKGPVSFDIIRILCLGLSVENRRANTQRYLNHYYTTFKSHFSTAPFTFSQLEESYRTHFNFVNATSLFSLSYYYKMYKDESLDLKSGADEREHKAQEILRRTIGILDDM